MTCNTCEAEARDLCVCESPTREWTFEAKAVENYYPCPECGNQLVEGEKEDEVTQWLNCLVCGFDCIK